MPGSGRTTLAKKLAGPKGHVISPESFVARRFKNKPFQLDHNKQCYVQGLRELVRKLETLPLQNIVLDRPHVQLWEMREAVRLAMKHNYRIKICLTTTPWAKDWKKCAKRTKHKITPAEFAMMAADFEQGVSPAKILRSLTPYAKEELCEELYRGLDQQEPAERKKTWLRIRREFPKQLTELIMRGGLLKAYGWPQTASDIAYLKPMDA